MPRRSPHTFDCLAAMRALGEPSRMRIVRQLLDGPHSVNELCEALSLTTYNVSRHLNVLKTAGLVQVEPQAQQRIYELADDFQQRLAKNNRVLDLGCCQFDFSKMPA